MNNKSQNPQKPIRPFGLGCGELVGLTASRLFLNLFTDRGGFREIWGFRHSRIFSRDKRLLCTACSAECSCSTSANRAARPLTLPRQASCGLWEISLNSSKDYTRSGEGCKLEADLWGFGDLLFTLMHSMPDGKYGGRRFNRGVMKLGTLGHLHNCLEDS